MEALLELFIAIISFILEMTFHALVFAWLLLRAAFSPDYRQKLRTEWQTSNWNRVAIVSGLVFYSAAAVFALWFWMPSFRDRPENHVQATTVRPSEKEQEELRSTKKLDELADKAGEIFRRKIEDERSSR